LDKTPDKDLTLGDLIAIYRRKREIFFGVVIAAFLLGATYCLICTRRYTAVGILQVQKESSDAMGLDSIMSSATDAPGGLDQNINLETQANILQSDTLALQTIEDLHLEDSRDFQHRWNPIGWVMNFVTPSGPPDPLGASIEDSPARQSRAIKIFSDRLKVKPIGGTRLIEIDYVNSNPKLAAAVINKLMQSLQDYTFQTRFDATNQASTWLSNQLGDLRKQTEDLQAQVTQLQEESGVYSFGTTDAEGREEAYSGIIDQLQQSTQALQLAEQNRILKGAIAQAANSGDAEMLSGLAGNTLNSPSQNNTLALIQSLREQQVTQLASLQEAEAKFGPGYPKLAEMRANLAAITTAINNEVDRI
jgi:polysaccharide biosynthesis transport protein